MIEDIREYWVALEGPTDEIDTLMRHLSALDNAIEIAEIEGGVFAGSAWALDLDDIWLIKRDFDRHLADVNLARTTVFLGPLRITSGAVATVQKDLYGNRRIERRQDFKDIKGSVMVLANDDPTPTAEHANTLLEAFRKVPSVARVVRFLESRTIYDLYKALEVIEKEEGGESQAAACCGVSQKFWNSLTLNMNSSKFHGESARHAFGNPQVPEKRRLSFSEMEMQINKMVFRWAQHKLSGCPAK